MDKQQKKKDVDDFNSWMWNWMRLGEIQPAKKVGKDDPKRIIHAMKVGFAIVAVSLFYYVNPLYENLGDAVMWAVMSVVVVFEYSVGATLKKSLNRMVATLLAVASAVLVHNMSNLVAWQIGQTIIWLLFVFMVAVMFTFMRSFPKLKAKFDYGLMISIPTFSLVSISAFGGEDVTDVATKRLVTIIIGSCIAVIVCTCVCPVWNGIELHQLVAGNLDKLGTFLEEGVGGEYIEEILDELMKKDESTSSSSYLEKYKSVLGSTKSTEENMANLAGWEPSHGQFKFRHPWKLYLKVGNLTRQCAYKIQTLTPYLHNSDQIQTSVPEIMRQLIKDPCVKRISIESGRALRELSRGLNKTKIRPSISQQHVSRSKSAAEELMLNHCMLDTVITLIQEDGGDQLTSLSELIPVATVTALLVEITTCVEEIVETVCELGVSAGFSVEESSMVVAPYCSDDDDTPDDDDHTVQEKRPVACNNGGGDHVVIAVNDEVELTTTAADL